NAELIIIGKGTHFNEVKEIANGISNVKVISELPKYEYDLLLKYADVGFVFLDERFTIPNYPSRATSYFALGKPVIAATDKCTDIGIEIEENNCGFWHNSSDVMSIIESVEILSTNTTLRKEQSRNARLFFEKEFKVEENVRNLLEEVERFKNEKSIR